MKKKRGRSLEVIGWMGVLSVLAAFILASFSSGGAHSMYYPILNLIGAAGIAIHSLYKKDYEPAVLNLIWVGIALVALVRMLANL